MNQDKFDESKEASRCEGSEPEARSLNVIIDRLLDAAPHDRELRLALRHLAVRILQRTIQGAPTPPPEPPPPQQVPPAREEVVEAAQAQESEPDEYHFEPASPPGDDAPVAPRQRSGYSRSVMPEVASDDASEAPDDEDDAAVGEVPHIGTHRPPGPSQVEVNDSDLPAIEARCRLKAEAARWAAARQRCLAEQPELSQELRTWHRDLIERAKGHTDCFLWMCHPYGPKPNDPARWDAIAESFDSCATAVTLVQSMLGHADHSRDLFDQGLHLLAEAQSTLRTAVTAITDRDDADQARLHRWLKRTASEQNLFIRRHMRVDDPARPENLAALSRRLSQAEQEWEHRRRHRRERRFGLRRVRYHIRKIADGSAFNPEHDWSVVMQTIDELITSGASPGDPQVRELLLTAIGSLPDVENVPEGFELVLREVDRYIATRPSADPDRDPPPPTADVEAVRQWAEGRSMLIVGGQRRRYCQENLVNAFGLRELGWIHVSPERPLSTFESTIARPDVVAVLYAARWSTQNFEGLKAVCEQYGKPVVRLPGGYGVNEVAAHILAQCREEVGQR